MARKGREVRGWRKLAVSTWGEPNDPQIYGDLELDATGLLAFIAAAREAGAPKLTVTHLVGKGLAVALGENPDLNGRLYRGRFVQRDTVDIFFIVSAEQGAELSGVKVERADEKPVLEIARELAERTARIHAGDDVEMGRTKQLFERFSPRLLRWAFRFGAWFTTDRDYHLPQQGLPRQPFGSAMVSSVGMFGIGHAYAPLSPYYRIPLLVLVGEVTPRPWAVNGEIVVRPIVQLSATLDHRYLDGFHAARLARNLRRYLEEPAAHEPRF